MTLQTPPQINNLEFAKKHHEIHGIIESYQFSRLADLIIASPVGAGANNKITYHLTGKLYEAAGEGAQWGLELVLKGQLSFVCQRCLNAMPYAIDVNAQFLVAPDLATSSLSGLEFESDGFDDIEVIPADEHMQVLDLIEDELLLTLPLAPMHSEEQHAAGLCVELSAIKEVGEVNPFEALKTLKK